MRVVYLLAAASIVASFIIMPMNAVYPWQGEMAILDSGYMPFWMLGEDKEQNWAWVPNTSMLIAQTLAILAVAVCVSLYLRSK